MRRLFFFVISAWLDQNYEFFINSLFLVLSVFLWDTLYSMLINQQVLFDKKRIVSGSIHRIRKSLSIPKRNLQHNIFDTIDWFFSAFIHAQSTIFRLLVKRTSNDMSSLERRWKVIKNFCMSLFTFEKLKVLVWK